MTKPVRLNVNLSAAVFQELQSMAKESQMSMTEIVRTALGLMRIAVQEAKNGNKLIMTSSNDRPLKEIVIPR